MNAALLALAAFQVSTMVLTVHARTHDQHARRVLEIRRDKRRDEMLHHTLTDKSRRLQECTIRRTGLAAGKGT